MSANDTWKELKWIIIYVLSKIDTKTEQYFPSPE